LLSNQGFWRPANEGGIDVATRRTLL